MAAGIVASTLRRRTFRTRLPVVQNYQALEPTSGSRTPRGTRLAFRDFWPTCLNSDEKNLKNLVFQSFESLIPAANVWLADNAEIHLVKLETLEQKISSLDELGQQSPMFHPKGRHALYLKGLRLWFIREKDSNSKASLDKNLFPVEIGYMNIIPKCLDRTQKYPNYERLEQTLDAVNEYLAEFPLEGKILTIETVPLKLSTRRWRGPEIDPDHTYFQDDYLRHVLYITRVYFVYGAPEAELIGVQDFPPEFLHSSRWKRRVYGIQPRYLPQSSAMQKAKEWMIAAKNVRISNFQTLDAIYRGSPDKVDTGLNFVEKIESWPLVRFVRVTFVRPRDTGAACGSSLYVPPTGFGYKTFVPNAVKVGMCSGAPDYEGFTHTWDRARKWLKIVDRTVIGAETFYHPVSRIWHRQDGGETSVLRGEWNSDHRAEKRHARRRTLVRVVRVYLDDDYTEPPYQMLPPSPRVEEYNDCCCLIM